MPESRRPPSSLRGAHLLQYAAMTPDPATVPFSVPLSYLALGAGQRDRAYTWTASIFFLLASELN